MQRKPEDGPRRIRGRTRPRRDLGDVLHHFFDDDEIRDPAGVSDEAIPEADPPATPEPTDSQAGAPEGVPAPVLAAVHWCVPASPERPLACALAVDLAAALARLGRPTRIVAGFPRPALLSHAQGVDWSSPAGRFSGSMDIEDVLDTIDGSSNTLLVLPPQDVATLLRGVGRDTLQGVLLPIDAGPRGLARALGWLRRFGPSVQRLRLGTVLIGASDISAGERMSARLAGAARRQLGLRVEHLGEIVRDRASDRSLLCGIPVQEIDASGDAARSLENLCRRMT